MYNEAQHQKRMLNIVDAALNASLPIETDKYRKGLLCVHVANFFN